MPGIKKMLKYVITDCKIYKENKYQRKPPDVGITATPLLSYPGKVLHMDILNTNKLYFLSFVPSNERAFLLGTVICATIFCSTKAY